MVKAIFTVRHCERRLSEVLLLPKRSDCFGHLWKLSSKYECKRKEGRKKGEGGKEGRKYKKLWSVFNDIPRIIIDLPGNI